MPIGSCQLLGYFLCIMSSGFVIALTIYPGWTVSDTSVNNNDNPPKQYGLWLMCRDSTLNMNSENFMCNSLQASQKDIQPTIKVTRVFMLIACSLALLAVTITPIGLQCTILGGDATTKCIIARVGALCTLLTGILCIISTIVYGNGIRNSVSYQCAEKKRLEAMGQPYPGEEDENNQATGIICSQFNNSWPPIEVFTFGPATYLLYLAAFTCMLSFIMTWIGSYNALPWVDYENESDEAGSDLNVAVNNPGNLTNAAPLLQNVNNNPQNVSQGQMNGWNPTPSQANTRQLNTIPETSNNPSYAQPMVYQNPHLNAENALKEDIQSQKPSTGGGIMKGGALSSHSMANSAAKKSSQVGFNQSVKSSSQRSGMMPGAGQGAREVLEKGAQAYQPASARLANTKHMESQNQSSPVPGIKGSQEFFKQPKQMPNGLPTSTPTQLSSQPQESTSITRPPVQQLMAIANYANDATLPASNKSASRSRNSQAGSEYGDRANSTSSSINGATAVKSTRTTSSKTRSQNQNTQQQQHQPPNSSSSNQNTATDKKTYV